MSTTVFAATINTTLGSQDIDVNAKFVDSISTPTKYSVDVAWDAMEFTYTVSGTKTWNPATHAYATSTQPAWSASGNTITVTNHSNTGLTLPTAEGKAVNDAVLTGKTSLTLGGTLASDISVLANVGTVIVTIS